MLRHKSAAALSGLEKTQSDAAAVLSGLLKELLSEQKAADHFSAVFQNWCRDSESQKQSMVVTMQRKVDESNIMMHQISSEVKRLESELSLIQANKQEKVQQLTEANETESFVAQEYFKELKDMDRTIEAARHAVHLAIRNTDHQNAQSEDANNAVSSLSQLNSKDVADSEMTIMGSYVDDPKPSENNHPMELTNALNTMLGHLESDRSAAAEGHDLNDRRVTAFIEHLNSSIFESNSQFASIQMEIAQRRREQIRLEGQVSDVSTLLSSIKDSKKNTGTVCFQYSQEQEEIAHYIRDEIDAAKAVLEQTSPETAEMFLTPSFLQLQQDTLGSQIHSVPGDLLAMAKKYPTDAAWYMSEAKKFRRLPSPHMSLAEHHSKPVIQPSSADATGNDALTDIQHFVETADSQDGGDVVTLSGEARPLLSDPAEVQKIKTSYKSLLAHVKDKQQSLQDSQKWCQFILREAKLDGTKTARTVNRMHARLNLVKGSAHDYEQDSTYYKSQGKDLENQMQRLAQLSNEADRQHSKSYEALREFSKQLMSVADELSELLTAEERRAADNMKSLIGKLENHQNMLTVQHKIWYKSKATLMQADTAVQAVMSTNVKHNNRRIIRSQIHSQFLTYRLHLRQHDTVLAGDFKGIAQEMCSSKEMASMEYQAKSVEMQADELQKSFAENIAPFA